MREYTRWVLLLAAAAASSWVLLLALELIFAVN